MFVEVGNYYPQISQIIYSISDFASYNNDHLILNCGLQSFEVMTKPLFANKTNLRNVQIMACLLPEISYANLFEQLNINVSYIRDLTIFEVPHQLRLRGAHFEGLNLRQLFIKGLVTDTLLHIKSDVLESLKHVELISFENVVLAPWPEDTTVVVVILERGRSEGVWGGCSNLRALIISQWDMSSRDWLSNCTKLKSLTLSRMPSIFTIIWMLEGAKSLQEVDIQNCNLPLLHFSLLHSVNLKKLSITQSNVYNIK